MIPHHAVNGWMRLAGTALVKTNVPLEIPIATVMTMLIQKRIVGSTVGMG
jgi:hypothetical protein